MCKIGWPPGHLDRVFRCNLTVTGFVTMFVLPPCIYPGDFFDYFIRDYFRFLDGIFYMWLLNFDIKPFCKLITDLDQDLKVIFWKLSSDIKVLDVNIKFVDNHLHIGIYQNPRILWVIQNTIFVTRLTEKHELVILSDTQCKNCHRQSRF